MIGALCLVVSLAQPSAAAVFWDRESLLKDFFHASEKVTYVELSGADVSSLGGKDHYVVYVGKTGDHVDGLAVIDDQIGQHMPITFGFLVDTDGRMRRAEVMVYREPYGDAIRERRFLDQLVHKQESDPLRPGSDIDGITGATISSRSAAVAAHRALVLCNLAKKKLSLS
jgi:Na+-translocating ferredoxin:NAD+ oxidoreductase RnfG subunit